MQVEPCAYSCTCRLYCPLRPVVRVIRRRISLLAKFFRSQRSGFPADRSDPGCRSAHAACFWTVGCHAGGSARIIALCARSLCCLGCFSGGRTDLGRTILVVVPCRAGSGCGSRPDHLARRRIVGQYSEALFSGKAIRVRLDTGGGLGSFRLGDTACWAAHNLREFLSHCLVEHCLSDRGRWRHGIGAEGGQSTSVADSRLSRARDEGTTPNLAFSSRDFGFVFGVRQSRCARCICCDPVARSGHKYLNDQLPVVGSGGCRSPHILAHWPSISGSFWSPRRSCFSGCRRFRPMVSSRCDRLCVAALVHTTATRVDFRFASSCLHADDVDPGCNKCCRYGASFVCVWLGSDDGSTHLLIRCTVRLVCRGSVLSYGSAMPHSAANRLVWFRRTEGLIRRARMPLTNSVGPGTTTRGEESRWYKRKRKIECATQRMAGGAGSPLTA